MTIVYLCAAEFVRRHEFEVNAGAEVEVQAVDTARLTRAETEQAEAVEAASEEQTMTKTWAWTPGRAPANESMLLETSMQMQRWSWACGDGNDAAEECVNECLEHEECRIEHTIIDAVLDTGALGLVWHDGTGDDGDGKGGHRFAVGSPCGSYYGDSIGGAISGFVRSWSRKSSYCEPGEHQNSECKKGRCVAYNDNRDRSIKNKSCGSKAECARKCLEDWDCVKQIRRDESLKMRVMEALQLRCVVQEKAPSDFFTWERTKCFYTPGNACVDKCQDGFRCDEGTCVGVRPEEPHVSM